MYLEYITQDVQTYILVNGTKKPAMGNRLKRSHVVLEAGNVSSTIERET